MDPQVMIRPYNAASDTETLRACIVELQDFHRSMEPSWPKGNAIVNDYVKYLEVQCAEYDGRVLIAERGGDLVGFVCVVASERADSPDDPSAFAWIHDIFVKPEHRRHGVASALMREAELFARSRGARLMRLGVLDRNGSGRAFYRGLGFRDYVRVLTKSLP